MVISMLCYLLHNISVLQKDYKKLQVAHLISQEKHTTELRVEREKNRFIQEKIEQLKSFTPKRHCEV